MEMTSTEAKATVPQGPTTSGFAQESTTSISRYGESSRDWSKFVLFFQVPSSRRSPREVLLNSADELMNYTKSEEQQMEDFVKELVDAKVTPRCSCVPVREGVGTALGIVCMCHTIDFLLTTIMTDEHDSGRLEIIPRAYYESCLF